MDEGDYVMHTELLLEDETCTPLAISLTSQAPSLPTNQSLLSLSEGQPLSQREPNPALFLVGVASRSEPLGTEIELDKHTLVKFKNFSKNLKVIVRLVLLVISL